MSATKPSRRFRQKAPSRISPLAPERLRRGTAAGASAFRKLHRWRQQRARQRAMGAVRRAFAGRCQSRPPPPRAPPRHCAREGPEPVNQTEQRGRIRAPRRLRCGAFLRVLGPAGRSWIVMSFAHRCASLGQRRSTKALFWPPKPKELETATSISRLRTVLASGRGPVPPDPDRRG